MWTPFSRIMAAVGALQRKRVVRRVLADAIGVPDPDAYAAGDTDAFCVIAHEDGQDLTADLKKFNFNSCEVSESRVVGKTDSIGGTVADRPVSPKDLLATAYHLLGYDLEHPVMRAGLESLDRFAVWREDGARMIELEL